MGAAAILTGVTGLIGGIAQKQAADAEAKVALYNAQLQQKQYEARAQLDERRAKDIEDQAEAQRRADAEQEKQIRRQAEVMRGQQTAAAGASGLAVESGTALQNVIDTQVTGEKDAATFNLNSARKRFASINSAQATRFEGAMNRQAGENAVALGKAQAAAYKQKGNNALLGSVIKNDWYRIFPEKKK